MHDHRRPQWIYGVGEEPDYRFSLANERTFLAWVRTSLGLIGGGVAVEAFGVASPRRALGSGRGAGGAGRGVRRGAPRCDGHGSNGPCASAGTIARGRR